MCFVPATVRLLSELATDSRAHDVIQGNVQIWSRHWSESVSYLGTQKKSDHSLMYAGTKLFIKRGISCFISFQPAQVYKNEKKKWVHRRKHKKRPECWCQLNSTNTLTISRLLKSGNLKSEKVECDEPAAQTLKGWKSDHAFNHIK